MFGVPLCFRFSCRYGDVGGGGGLYPGGLLLLSQWSKHVTSIILSISMVQKHVIHLDGCFPFSFCKFYNALK
jgi:hypothetical protein